jgi:hypothetical protein
MKLKKTILSKIRRHPRLRLALADYFVISRATLYRWLNDNSTSFTEYQCLLLICAYLEVDDPADLCEQSELVKRYL